ncbi:MAG: RHS repeat domain-containing protein [Nitrospirota bacterium]
MVFKMNFNREKFTYDAAGRRTSLAYPNGVAASYDYDSLGQVTDIVNALNGNPVAYNSYTYDALGNRLTNTDMNGTNAYSYDVFQRLTDALHPAIPEETFAYDGVGNRLNGSGLSYTYTSGNRMLTRDTAHYAYDANGNTISKTDASGVTNYKYDFENRLIEVDLPNNTVAKYEYDALGRRIEKNVNGVIKRYLYDGYNILAEYDSNGNQTARYTQNLAIDDPLAMTRGGSVYYYHKDALGSITALTDVNGQTAQTYAYDSFGNIASQTGNIENPFTYTGREYDQETGLYYYRARYYDSRAGRFINEDPIGFWGGINFFGYVSNDPIIGKDALGLQESQSSIWGPEGPPPVFNNYGGDGGGGGCSCQSSTGPNWTMIAGGIILAAGILYIGGGAAIITYVLLEGGSGLIAGVETLEAFIYGGAIASSGFAFGSMGGGVIYHECNGE